MGGKPLYGAQQIPGKDSTLRAADVTFKGNNYARANIVKASSAVKAAEKINWRLEDLAYASDNNIQVVLDRE